MQVALAVQVVAVLQVSPAQMAPRVEHLPLGHTYEQQVAQGAVEQAQLLLLLTEKVLAETVCMWVILLAMPYTQVAVLADTAQTFLDLHGQMDCLAQRGIALIPQLQALQEILLRFIPSVGVVQVETMQLLLTVKTVALVELTAAEAAEAENVPTLV